MDTKQQEISRETFYQWHWVEEKSTKEIGKLLGCCGETARRHMVALGVETRKSTAMRMRKGIHKKPSPDLSYLIGILFGDGNVYTSAKDNQVTLKVKDKAFIENFITATTRLGYASCQPYMATNRSNGRSYFKSAFHSLAFATWWKTTAVEERLSLAAVYPRDFIRGVYEAEGSAFLKDRRYRLTINMCNAPVMCYIDGLLRGENYPTRLSPHSTAEGNTCYRIEISGQASAYRFLKEFHPCIKNPLLYVNTEPRRVCESDSDVCRDYRAPTLTERKGKDIVRPPGKLGEVSRND